MTPSGNYRQQARDVRALKGERALAYVDERIGFLEAMGDAAAAQHWRATRACIVEEERGAGRAG